MYHPIVHTRHNHCFLFDPSHCADLLLFVPWSVVGIGLGKDFFGCEDAQRKQSRSRPANKSNHTHNSNALHSRAHIHTSRTIFNCKLCARVCVVWRRPFASLGCLQCRWVFKLTLLPCLADLTSTQTDANTQRHDTQVGKETATRIRVSTLLSRAMSLIPRFGSTTGHLSLSCSSPLMRENAIRLWQMRDVEQFFRLCHLYSVIEGVLVNGVNGCRLIEWSSMDRELEFIGNLAASDRKRDREEARTAFRYTQIMLAPTTRPDFIDTEQERIEKAMNVVHGSRVGAPGPVAPPSISRQVAPATPTKPTYTSSNTGSRSTVRVSSSSTAMYRTPDRRGPHRHHVSAPRSAPAAACSNSNALSAPKIDSAKVTYPMDMFVDPSSVEDFVCDMPGCDDVVSSPPLMNCGQLGDTLVEHE